MSRVIQFGLVIISLFCFAGAFYLRVHAPTRVMGGSVVLGPPGAKAKAWPAASFEFSVKPTDIRVSQMAEAVLTVTVTTMHGPLVQSLTKRRAGDQSKRRPEGSRKQSS